MKCQKNRTCKKQPGDALLPSPRDTLCSGCDKTGKDDNAELDKKALALLRGYRRSVTDCKRATSVLYKIEEDLAKAKNKYATLQSKAVKAFRDLRSHSLDEGGASKIGVKTLLKIGFARCAHWHTCFSSTCFHRDWHLPFPGCNPCYDRVSTRSASSQCKPWKESSKPLIPPPVLLPGTREKIGKDNVFSDIREAIRQIPTVRCDMAGGCVVTCSHREWHLQDDTCKPHPCDCTNFYTGNRAVCRTLDEKEGQ
jgi:hypothetical protein